MDTTLIEARTGWDNGSNAGNGWDKTRIVGLNLVEEYKDKGKRWVYIGAALEAPAGEVFSFWTSAHRADAHFYIILVDPEAAPLDIKGYAGCFVKGRMRILAEAHGGTYAPRLLSWWTEGTKSKAQESLARKEAGEPATYTRTWMRRYAEHLATQIGRRGIKHPDPLPELPS